MTKEAFEGAVSWNFGICLLLAGRVESGRMEVSKVVYAVRLAKGLSWLHKVAERRMGRGGVRFGKRMGSWLLKAM